MIDPDVLMMARSVQGVEVCLHEALPDLKPRKLRRLAAKVTIAAQKPLIEQLRAPPEA